MPWGSAGAFSGKKACGASLGWGSGVWGGDLGRRPSVAPVASPWPAARQGCGELMLHAEASPTQGCIRHAPLGE